MKATGLEGLERLHRLILGVLISAMLLLASLVIAAVIGIALLIAGFMSGERLADSATSHAESFAIAATVMVIAQEAAGRAWPTAAIRASVAAVTALWASRTIRQLASSSRTPNPFWP
jgi:hydrogenase/urease accessory protein HupE